MANEARINQSKQCPECLGAGNDSRFTHSLCFNCGGSGQVPRPAIYTPVALPGTIKTPDEQIADLRAEVAELTRRIAALEAGES